MGKIEQVQLCAHFSKSNGGQLGVGVILWAASSVRPRAGVTENAGRSLGRELRRKESRGLLHRHVQ